MEYNSGWLLLISFIFFGCIWLEWFLLAYFVELPVLWLLMHYRDTR